MVKMRHVDKHYKKKQILFDFSVDIETECSNVYGLIGPNGAGKTTILKIMSGILGFTKGQIIKEENANYLQWCKKNVILIPAGERGLRYKNTVYDNVMFFSAIKGVDEEKSKLLLEEYVSILHFEEFLNRRIETLSLGQKKKAMLLCGLCTDMTLILMDEPSNGLDIDAQVELQKVIRLLSEKYKKTFIISSHDLTFVSDIVDHYIYIFNGRNVSESAGDQEITEIQNTYRELKEREKIYAEPR